MDRVGFLKTLFDYLNQNTRYALLRNFEGLPERNDSRDIDMAISHQDYICHRKALVHLVEDAGWKIVTYLNSDRLVTWVCGTINEQGATDLVQLDFFFHTSVYGMILIENDDLLEHRLFNGKVYHVDAVYEFLDKYLYNRAVGAKYPEKYHLKRERAKKDSWTTKGIRLAFGCQSLEECDSASKKALLIGLLKQNLRRYGIKTLWNYLKFEYYHLRNYVHSNTGFSIGFTGPDGSGKTTVIDLMIENFGEVFRKAHVYFHFRPMLFGNLGEVAHNAGIKKDVDRNFDKPHRGGKTGILSSLLRLGYYSVDYILGYFLRVKPVTRITRLAIFDRYYTDIICDSRRSRIYLPVKFLYGWGRCFIPSLDYNILLTASTETILARKKELDKEGIESINRKIDYLSSKPRFYKIMNDGTPQATVTEILRIVFENQHYKNIKRIL